MGYVTGGGIFGFIIGTILGGTFIFICFISTKKAINDRKSMISRNTARRKAKQIFRDYRYKSPVDLDHDIAGPSPNKYLNVSAGELDNPLERRVSIVKLDGYPVKGPQVFLGGTPEDRYMKPPASEQSPPERMPAQSPPQSQPQTITMSVPPKSTTTTTTVAVHPVATSNKGTNSNVVPRKIDYSQNNRNQDRPVGDQQPKAPMFGKSTLLNLSQRAAKPMSQLKSANNNAQRPNKQHINPAFQPE